MSIQPGEWAALSEKNYEKEKFLLQKVSYEHTQRSLTPKNGEEMDESDERVWNEIWD